jgi:hypothetical protein
MDGNLISSGVTLVHRGYPDLPPLEDLERWAERNPEATTIVISGAPQSRTSGAPNLYFRKAGVGTPADEHFAQLFRNFHSALLANRRDFSLLEPGQVPDELLAAYLVCLATSGNGSRLELNDPLVSGILHLDVWAIAQTQYKSGSPDVQKSGPASGIWPQDIFENGKTKPGVVEALRSALHNNYVPGGSP